MPRSPLAQAIRQARRYAGLTQGQLGRQLGLKGEGQAVYRWERDESTPRKRTYAPLVNVISAANASAGHHLAVALGLVPAQPADSTTTADKVAALERALFRMADELDLPPRRVRAAVLGLLQRTAEARIPLDATLRQLEIWVAEDQGREL